MATNNIMKIIRILKKKIGLLKQERFVILCHQRSGSNMLTSILNKHPSIQLLSQIFKHDPDTHIKLQAHGVIPFQGFLFNDKIEDRNKFDILETKKNEREFRNTTKFVESFFEKYFKESLASCVGFKIHGGTLYSDEIESILLDGSYKIILLHRKNLLQAAISWYVAREKNLWTLRSGLDEHMEEIKIEIKQLTWFIENTRSDINLWKELLKKNNVECLELFYEDILKRNFDLDSIWGFLDINNIKGLEPSTSKIIKNYEFIVNLNEIKESLASEENGFL